jgi:hypothetical protein
MDSTVRGRNLNSVFSFFLFPGPSPREGEDKADVGDVVRGCSGIEISVALDKISCFIIV